MSRQDTRAEIAQALSAVTGVHGFAARPSVMSSGDGWPQWRGSQFAGGHSFADTWVILVVMPSADDVTADRFADQHAEAIIDALRPIVFIDSVEPAEIPADGKGGALRALAFTGRSE